jgi:polysaccharide export outer membrane protein
MWWMSGEKRRPLALALALVAGCAMKTPSAPGPRPAGDPFSPQPYRLKVGDQLDIRFYKTPELNIEVPIRSDGKISLEVLGDVNAAGLTPDEFSHQLTKQYSSELTNPRVTVIVRNFGGQVYVSGEVTKPTSVLFANGMTALQAISTAGGFADTARRDSVILIRHTTDGKYEGYRLTLEKALTGEDLAADVPLEPSDVIHVPKSRIANMNLFVKQYIQNNLPVTPAIPLF